MLAGFYPCSSPANLFFIHSNAQIARRVFLRISAFWGLAMTALHSVRKLVAKACRKLRCFCGFTYMNCARSGYTLGQFINKNGSEPRLGVVFWDVVS